MKLTFTGDTIPVQPAINTLKTKFDFEIYESGYKVVLFQSKALKLEMFDNHCMIHYQEINDFCRLFALFILSRKQKNKVTLVEEKQFEHLGVMIDCSRNAVPKTFAIHQLLIEIACLGFDTLMLYTEDTYKIKDEPYFGHFRGAYSFEELKEIDNFAEGLGIEIIPCIQTLAHLTNVLQWYPYYGLRDTEDILLVDHPQTYELIEKMIQAASAPFRSKRIHIGMDEAHFLGLGRFLHEHGYHDRFTIMQNHLEKVMTILEKSGLKPMMWSDMYFRMGSATGDYYDLNAKIPKDIVSQIPDIEMVYWDYYHAEETEYETLLQKHRLLNKPLIFAGGIWTFNGIAPNYGKSFVTTQAALTACKKENIKEVFATVWLDDGAETPLQTIVPGLVLFAEHQYQKKVSQNHFETKLALFTGTTFEDWMLLQKLDEIKGVDQDNLTASAPSKCLLWQDPLLGLYDANFDGISFSQYYTNLAMQINRVECTEPYLPLFEFYRQLALVLSIKADLGINLAAAYQNKDTNRLQELLKAIIFLKEQLLLLKDQHAALWHTVNKPHGWEILDIRYGGLLARLETSCQRIHLFLDNQVEIPELEDPRLPTVSVEQLKKGNRGRQLYRHIISASKLSDV